MTRITPLKREDLPESEDIFAYWESVLGFLPNSLLTLGRRPDILAPLTELGKAVLSSSPSGLPAELKSLVSYVASLSAGCLYCQAHTAAISAERGAPSDKIAAAFRYETDDLFDQAERAALRLAQSAATAPNQVDERDFEALRRHFTDDQILELIAVISLYGFFNRWNDTLATELEERPTGFAGRHLSGTNWRPGKHESHI